jgi:hypothetical protein
MNYRQSTIRVDNVEYNLEYAPNNIKEKDVIEWVVRSSVLAQDSAHFSEPHNVIEIVRRHTLGGYRIIPSIIKEYPIDTQLKTQQIYIYREDLTNLYAVMRPI